MEADRESSVANEVGGPTNLLDGDCCQCVACCTGTREEHSWNFVMRKGDVDYDGASCYTTTTRTTHYSSSRIQMPEARAIDNFATAQAQTDTRGLIDVNGLHRPKEFSGKKEDFHHWTTKKNGGILRCSDRGAQDDVGVGC